jgi:hypothetical protein
MERKRITRLILGILLILVGLWFLLAQWIPALVIWDQFTFSWPWFVIGAGILLFLICLLSGEADMAVPATIVTGVGALLLWQNETGRWDTWAYAWTLIPGFVAIGIILAGLFKGEFRQGFQDGFPLLIISLVLFVIFSFAFDRSSGYSAIAGAILLILVGLGLIIRPLLRR